MNDAIFDFHAQHQVHPHTLPADSGMMCAPPMRDNLSRANERFAQQIHADAIREHNQYMDNGYHATAEMTSLFMQSTKLAEDLNFDKIINTYLSFAQKSNLPSRDVANSFKRSIIASLKVTDRTTMYEIMEFDPPQEGLANIENSTDNVYGDYSEWEKILHTLSFHEESTREYLLTSDSNFGNNVPTVKFVLQTLEHVGADDLSMSDKLKIYLLINIKNVSSLVAIKAFLAEAMPATFNSTAAVNTFTAAIADTRFSSQDFAGDLTWFMQNVIIDNEFQLKCAAFMDTKDNMLQWSLREGTKQHVTRGRVRLRYRAGIEQMAASHVSGDSVADTTVHVDDTDRQAHQQQTFSCTSAANLSQIHEDSLQGWTVRARVPPAVLHTSKLLGYLLMSQISFADPTAAIQKHFIHDAEIAENMLRQYIYKPQVSVIVEFLQLISVRVVPFEELRAFRAECFTDFSYTDSKDLSWLTFLQLYIACHQNKDIWPLVWKHFCSVLSHQVLLAVSTFKSKYTYAVDKVADICMQEDELSRKVVHNVN